MSRNHVLIDLAENLFTHMRMIRRKTIGEQDRVDRSIRDHMNIIEALEARDTERAEDLVRNHALGLADHVAKVRRLSGLNTAKPMPHFFCKLIAPRPTFPFDMNESEKALMGEHAAYWTKMCNEAPCWCSAR
jgi:hypothetical protein